MTQPMSLIRLGFALVLASLAMAAPARPMSSNPVTLNIGIGCRWEGRCMSAQRGAMTHALRFVAGSRPPIWKIQLCNRNASRRGGRVDWIGFDNCIRNPRLRPMLVRASRRR
jgi:hypothetical protein